MTHPEDTPEERLTRLDPVRTDPAPRRGSTRYESILETAMNTANVPIPMTESQGLPDPASPVIAFEESSTRRRGPRRPRRSRRFVLTGAAAAAVLAAVAVVALGSNEQPSAAATVAEAATNTGEITRLRARLTRQIGDEPKSISTAEIDGSNLRINYAGDDGPTVMTIVGDTVWETVADETTSQPYDEIAQGRLAPFGSSSEAVVRAALHQSEVEAIGPERVGGVDATRYRIRPSTATRAALSDLTPAVLGWFELEHPEQVTEIDVWVTDDLIHRIQVTSDAGDTVGSATIDFYDFGADITITPPG